MYACSVNCLYFPRSTFIGLFKALATDLESLGEVTMQRSIRGCVENELSSSSDEDVMYLSWSVYETGN